MTREEVAAAKPTTAVLGKNAAIRQIMKERGKKMQEEKKQNNDKPRRAENDEERSKDSGEEPEIAMEETKQQKVITSFYNNGIPHAVTFDDEVILEHQEQTAAQYYMVNDDEDDDQSLSSSYWAMMEHFHGTTTAGDNEWKDMQISAFSDEAAIQLLGTSLITVASDKSSNNPSPGSSNSSESEDEPSSSTASIANHDDCDCAGELFPEQHQKNSSDDDGAVASNNEVAAADETKLSINSFPPSELTSTPPPGIMKPVAAVPVSSPFSTFRQNSTNIALHETQFYYRKIEALEEKLAQAEEKAAKEAAKRVESERRAERLCQEQTTRLTTSTTPGTKALVRTPAPPSSAQTFSGKSYRSCPTTPGGTVVLPESLWERNKTLVKEVCFAGQTCVELSGQKLALEKHLDLLEKQYERSLAENETLKQEVLEANRKSARAAAEVESLRERVAESEQTKSLKPRQEQSVEAERERLELEPDAGAETANLEMEQLESQLDNVRKACKAGELRESALNKLIQNLTAKLESSRSETEALKSQIAQERVQLVDKVKSAFAFMDQQSEQLGGRMLDKVLQLDAKLRELTTAVQFMSGELSFDHDSEQSLLPTYDDQVGSVKQGDASVSSEVAAFNATFSENNNRSADLELMEEARTNDPQNHLEVSGSADVNETNEPSISTRSDEGTSLSISDGMAHVLSGVSSLSHDVSNSCDNGDGEAKFLQHLQWMASPDSVRENTAGTSAANNDLYESRNMINEAEVQTLKTGSNHKDSSAAAKVCGLESRIKSLQSELKFTEAELLKICEERDSFGKQLDDLIPSSSEKTAALKEAQQRIVELEAALASMTGAAAESENVRCELETVKNEKALLEIDVSAKSQALEEAKASLVHQTEERDLLSDRLSVLQREKEQVKVEIENLTDQKRELEGLTSSYETATTELKTLRGRLQYLEEEKDEVTTKLNQTSASLADAQDEKGELRASIAKLSAAAKESESLRDSLVSLQLERDELLAKLNTKTNALCNEVAASTSGFPVGEQGSAKIRFDVLQREKKQLELQLEQKAIFPKVFAPSTRQRDDKALSSLKEANEKLSLEVRSLASALKEAERKNAKLSATEAALSRTARACDSLKAEARALLDEKENQNKALQETEAALLSARQECESLRSTKSEVRRLQEDLQAAEADMEELQGAYDNCNESLHNLLEKNADLEAQIENAQIMQQETEDLVTETENRFLEMQNNFEQLQVDRDALFNKLEELAAYMDRVEKDRVSLKAQLDDKSAALLEAEKARDVAATEVKSHRELEEKYASERVALELLLMEKKAEISSQAEQLEDYVERISSIEAELSNTREYLRQSEDEASELRVRNEGLVTKCDRLRDYIRKLTKKCDEWEEFHKRETQVLQHLKLAHDRTRQKASELAEKVHERDQLHSAEKAAWVTQHSCLKQAQVQLERELDVIAEELSHVASYPLVK